MNKDLIVGFLTIVVIGWVISSCNTDRVFEDYRDFEDGSWKLEEKVSFKIREIQPQSTIPVVSIRYTDTYEFHNLYIRFVQEDSTASILQDTLVNIALFDSKTGRPIGKGFGNRHTVYDTLLGKGKIFPETTQITIWQYMRKERLEGIESVGIKLLGDN
ncbi:gliding motility lipoprotein GldH [Lunatibacter salilacus]|uniref:gliding motility lipoprotein GldH n=1 Tax=Lunatibacter salilacus TaxID=2483804 RepID=UPI001F308B0A|nr:gliding motility lipoprotein GldH [Lunatibacter salilacus]